MLASHQRYKHSASSLLSFKEKQKQQAHIVSLEQEVQRLEQELGSDTMEAEKIVKSHIKLLHRYNEAKDAAQILIGRLACLKETTVGKIHKDMELPMGD
ncbi:hypothetical protein D9757_007203 [Collybiopsis confluens]|uniref:DNA repair protein SWI5 homolog n=1 Tax=Collybiopsis confluens TaxID=2823264 RepID=A0A8H5HAS9_9AGAR|nr:hypothetical protein D9757_007203 [Collybiopsis confluens]